MTVKEYEKQTGKRYIGEARFCGRVIGIGGGRKEYMGKSMAATDEGWVATEVLNVVKGG